MKIVGNTVGTTIPKPNWEQADPSKGDYIYNKPKVMDGEDGYTPVRGVDYWTEEDKQEIKSYVDNTVSELSLVKINTWEADD